MKSLLTFLLLCFCVAIIGQSANIPVFAGKQSTTYQEQPAGMLAASITLGMKKIDENNHEGLEPSETGVVLAVKISHVQSYVQSVATAYQSRIPLYLAIRSILV